jgi:hypothetical protein
MRILAPWTAAVGIQHKYSYSFTDSAISKHACYRGGPHKFYAFLTSTMLIISIGSNKIPAAPDTYTHPLPQCRPRGYYLPTNDRMQTIRKVLTLDLSRRLSHSYLPRETPAPTTGAASFEVHRTMYDGTASTSEVDFASFNGLLVNGWRRRATTACPAASLLPDHE